MRSPKNFDIFDIHHHVGRLDAVVRSAGAGAGGALSVEDDIGLRLGYMDRHNIAAALVMPANGYPAPNGIADTRRVNDYVAEYRDRRPDRFPAALGTVSPLEGDAALDEIDRCVRDLGMRGIVWHHRFQGANLDHPMMDAFLDRVRAHGVLPFVHIIADSTLEAPWRLEVLADRHPGLTFVALDGFSGPDQAHWMTYLASKHPNVIFDTGVMISVAHLIESFVASAGAERLLLGTDFYSVPKLFNHPFPIFELLGSDLSDVDCAAILGGNARRLLGLT
jgi:predicted TIM-barrel fold metal-dependent hydrolase